MQIFILVDTNVALEWA